VEWGGLTSPTEARGRVATTELSIGEMMSNVFFPDMVSIDRIEGARVGEIRGNKLGGSSGVDDKSGRKEEEGGRRKEEGGSGGESKLEQTNKQTNKQTNNKQTNERGVVNNKFKILFLIVNCNGVDSQDFLLLPDAIRKELLQTNKQTNKQK